MTCPSHADAHHTTRRAEGSRVLCSICEEVLVEAGDVYEEIAPLAGQTPSRGPLVEVALRWVRLRDENDGDGEVGYGLGEFLTRFRKVKG